MASFTATLPALHRALVQEVKTEPLVLQQRATPQATPGSAVIRIISAPIVSYMRDAYDGTRTHYFYPTPIVPGTSAIGRVISLGLDAVKLKPGDLVFIDCMIRGRDDSEAVFLLGLSDGGTVGSRKLMHEVWRDSTFAEYAKVPLENCFLVDEARLCQPRQQGGLGYEIDQLCWVLKGLVPFGGLRSIRLQAGETIIISPATGGFGSAAVLVALAMGARVIAMGRNKVELAKIQALDPSRVKTVPITGNVGDETTALRQFGRIDAFLDISPAAAQASSHLKAAITSLRRGGRVSLMGGMEEIQLPHRYIMRFDISLQGKWMYDREDVLAFLQMVETGVLNVQNLVEVSGRYGLEDWKIAFDVAYEQGGRLGHLTVFHP